MTKVDNENYDCEVYAKENAVCVGTDGAINTASLPWGIYPDSGGSNGFPSSVYNPITEAIGMSAIDTPVPNTTTSGIKNADGSSSDYRYVRDSFLDASKDDGYAVPVAGGAAARFDGKTETGQIVGHANLIIERFLQEQYPNIGDIKIPANMTELADAMAALVAQNSGATSPNRYRQMFNPAAYTAYLYQPEVGEGEALDDQYKKTKWHLPALGTLTRIYNFFYNSCNRVTWDNGGRINVSYADFAPESEALTPLFANLLKKIREVTNTDPFTMPNNSYYWSSTEYNTTFAWLVNFNSGYVSSGYTKYGSHVVRPVAVFRFHL